MKKTAFLAPGTDCVDNHLWFVISDQNENGMVMVVSVTSNCIDKSCILDVGDHQFIKHRSSIAYNYAKELNAMKLLNDYIKKYVVKKPDISDALLNRIQEGAKKSPRLHKKFQRYYSLF